jgi:hypothetical protein
LREAKSQGAAPILRTTLVKFLYLLDVYTAEENEGAHVSGVEWRFYHFGPFSDQVVTALDTLTSRKLIFADSREITEGDKEFVPYSLNNSRAFDLLGLGISGSIQRRIHADLKRYAKDLPRLLDFVYFRTAPMADAQPGEVLDFSDCRKAQFDDVKPIQMQKLRPKAIKETRSKLRELMNARKAQNVIEHGPYDEVYFSGLDMMDEVALETGLSGRAKLKT